METGGEGKMCSSDDLLVVVVVVVVKVKQVVFLSWESLWEKVGRRGMARDATTGSLGVSDLIDKDTRAQGRRMMLDSEGGAGSMRDPCKQDRVC